MARNSFYYMARKNSKIVIFTLVLVLSGVSFCSYKTGYKLGLNVATSHVDSASQKAESLHDVKPLLTASPSEPGFLSTPTLDFLTDSRSPCFALKHGTINVGKITTAEALQRGYQIQCLPYAYLAGFTKGATSSIFNTLAKHSLVWGPYKNEYKKEAHFWDNYRLKANYTLGSYSLLFDPERIAQTAVSYSGNIQKRRDIIFMDGSPRTIWHGATWHDDIENALLREPRVLLPHKIHHINPQSKFILSLRNPTSRLFSDFKCFYQGEKTPEVFHEKVVDAISWWNNCSTMYGSYPRACAYGQAPMGLPPLSYDQCTKNKTFTRVIQKKQPRSCSTYYSWTDNATSSIFNTLAKHSLVWGPYKNEYKKEAHFWDNYRLKANYTLGSYSLLFDPERIAQTAVSYSGNIQKRRDIIFMDGSPRTIWHGATWHDDIENALLREPRVLLPHKIHHINLQSKFILSLRNPTSRLFSDFKCFYQGEKTPEVFHEKVVDAISWWNNCSTMYGSYPRACAYGQAPMGLPPLSYDQCTKNKTFTRVIQKKQPRSCSTYYSWTDNAADRLRVGMYDLYLKDWFQVFPRENFLFLKFEDYIDDPLGYVNEHIMPFLKLSPREERKHKRKEYIPSSSIQMLSKTKVLLDKFYKKSRESLVRLLNDDRFFWND